jgi:DNA-binding phage protein
MPTKSFDELQQRELQDPQVAAEYLSASIEEGSVDQLLLALRCIADARGGLGALSDGHSNQKASSR